MVRCPTEIELELFLAGQCPPDEATRIRAHGESCERCRTWLDEAASDEEELGGLRDLLARGAAEASALETDAAPSPERYQVLRRIGAGGMGVVYEAEQRSPRRRVALKVLRADVSSSRTRRRFEHEVELLGRLAHPGIARVFEADTFEVDGLSRPFFAMELVDGLPLHRHVNEHGLDTRARLELFVRICDAVHHAHQKGVLHRDLKPTNILVTTQGEPKVLDFGVARSLDDGDASLVTRAGQIVGTLPYMSPEQVAGDPAEVDTRSDVYALGVLLFQLVSGRMPHDVADKPAPEVVRMIAADEPRRLRHARPGVALDLETIAAKALEKDRARRYQSVDALADDVRRFLADEPIAARPPGKLYLLRKLVRRNKGVAAGLALAFAALAFGIVATSRQAVRAGRAEEDARREARTVERVNEFLVALLGSDAPGGQARPLDYTVRQALADSEQWIRSRLAEEPLVEASVRVVLGALATERGEHEEAARQLETALRLRTEELGPDHVKVGAALNALAVQRYHAERRDEAEQMFRRALEIYARHPGEHEAFVGTTQLNLAGLMMDRGDLEQADELLEQAVARHERALGEGDPAVARDLQRVAQLRQLQGRDAEVEAVLREALAIYEASPGAGSSDAARLCSALLELLERDGRLTEAIGLGERALEAYRRTRGDDDLQVGVTRSRLALLRLNVGRPEEARADAVAAIDLFRGHPQGRESLADTLHVLGQIEMARGDTAAALDAFWEAFDRRSELRGPDHASTRDSASWIAEIERRGGG